MLKLKYRLTKRSSFSYVYRTGSKKSAKALSLIFVKSRSLKIGFAVNNKIGNAVVRNKLKRRLRAVFIKLTQYIKNVQLIVSVHPGFEKLTYKEIEREVIGLLTNSNLLLPAYPGNAPENT